jgi:hypothetical protein
MFSGSQEVPGKVRLLDKFQSTVAKKRTIGRGFDRGHGSVQRPEASTTTLTEIKARAIVQLRAIANRWRVPG